MSGARQLLLAATLTACGPGGGDEPSAWLCDVTAEAGLDVVHEPAEGYGSLVDRLGGGVCVLDADGEGPMDLFFAGRAGSSRLAVAAAPLSFRDATSELPGITRLDAIGCLALDVDGDADDDLVVTGVGTLALFVHDAGGWRDATERLHARVPPRHVLTSAAAGDIDRDGEIDLVVAGLSDVTSLDEGDCGGVPCAVLVGRHPAIGNWLLRGRGAGEFEPDPAASGPLAQAEPTLVVAVVDLDSDGWLDVYVGNDAGDSVRDRALTWDGAQLADVSDRIGLAYDSRGHGIDTMGFAAGDVDGDLDLDFAVTAFDGYPSPIFVCQAAECEDLGRQLGMLEGVDSFRWANALVDLNLDGVLDLVEVAGHVYTEDEGRALGFALHAAQPLNVYTGGRLDGFVAARPLVEGDALAMPLEARGLAITDLDEDGRPDLVVTQSRGSARLLVNRRAPAGRPLVVSIVGDAVGARVTVRSGAFAAVRPVLRGEGFLGSHDPRLFFGVPGSEDAVVTLERIGEPPIVRTVPASARALEL